MCIRDSDIIYEIGLTPNRSDAHSHIGVARDLVAALAVVYNIDLPLKMPVATIAPTTENLISVTIAANEDCLRYSGVVVNNLTVAASPTWLQNRLLAIGLKPSNNVVDITNFVSVSYTHLDVYKRQTNRWIWKNWLNVSCIVGLVCILENHCIPFCDASCDEFITNTSTRWRPCDVYFV